MKKRKRKPPTLIKTMNNSLESKTDWPDSCEPEICVNLWCFVDEQTGLIYLLAGRAYALTGTTEEKLALLQRLSLSDFCAARTFPVPWHYSVHTPGEEPIEGVVAPQAVRLIHAELFEHVFQGLEKDLPVHFQTVAGEPQPHRLKIPDNPLCVTTCVVEYEDGRLEAKAAGAGFSA